ncbi:MAG TPA: NTP transferase domain-containing protein [Chthoniobacterales bacterium]|jgi:NDP-sugar pyrophosphorylase family protein|nr:NTP transferase domain-containing protein [Chthoniobacterales bacterium]
MTVPVSTLRAGVLAAGRGERLRGHGSELKPLIRVAGETLIERVLNSLSEAGATEVVVIINEDSTAVREHVAQRSWPFSLQWVVETTPSSMHSFLRLVETLAADGDAGPFLLSTVDTVAAPNAYADFFARASPDDAVVTLALTSPGADEKPLLVRTAGDASRVVAFGEGEQATAGVYLVRPVILSEAEAARRDGLDALRKFLGRLLERGYPLAGIPISKSIDVDRPPDVQIAETFLSNAQR